MTRRGSLFRRVTFLLKPRRFWSSPETRKRLVISDHFGGAEIVSASFWAVIMAINQTPRADLLSELKDGTESGRAELKARFERALESLGSGSTR